MAFVSLELRRGLSCVNGADASELTYETRGSVPIQTRQLLRECFLAVADVGSDISCGGMMSLRSQLEEGEVDYRRSRLFMSCVYTETLSNFRSLRVRPGARAPFDKEVTPNADTDGRDDL